MTVFAKHGVCSRAELSSRTFDQYVPRQVNGMPLGGDAGT
jgi:hypothetical protein